jgi:hypothetical protein
LFNDIYPCDYLPSNKVATRGDYYNSFDSEIIKGSVLKKVFRLILEESYFIVFDYYCTLAVWGILLVSNPAGSWAAIGATGYKY